MCSLCFCNKIMLRISFNELYTNVHPRRRIGYVHPRGGLVMYTLGDDWSCTPPGEDWSCTPRGTIGNVHPRGRIRHEHPGGRLVMYTPGVGFVMYTLGEDWS